MISRPFLAVALVAGLLLAGALHVQQSRRDARDAALKAEQQQRDDAMLAARIESEQQAKRERAVRQHALAGALELRQTLKDPGSFELQSAVVYPNGAACYRYRARGGAERRAVYDAKLGLSADARRWNQQCSGDGRELGDEVMASAPAPTTARAAVTEQAAPANTDAVRGAIVVPLLPREPTAAGRPRSTQPR